MNRKFSILDYPEDGYCLHRSHLSKVRVYIKYYTRVEADETAVSLQLSFS